MSSILSTQNRHTFLRRKYCFLPAMALSPPVGRCDAATGLPPLCSAIVIYLAGLFLLTYGSAGHWRARGGRRRLGRNHGSGGSGSGRSGLAGGALFAFLLALFDLLQLL